MPRSLITLLGLLLVGVLAVQPCSAERSSPVGRWKTIDDATGQAKSIVEIYERDGKLFGRVVRLLLKPADTRCDQCTDARRDQPVVGMDILQDMRADGAVYSGGTILDPGNGKVYRAKLWLDQGVLQVRGYVAFFFRTQQWLPAD